MLNQIPCCAISIKLCYDNDNYFDKSIMIVTKGVQFGSTEIKQGLSISINNIVALALLQVDKVKHLSNLY
jgi:hypothetical protein